MLCKWKYQRPKVSCVVFHLLLVCLLPPMRLIFNNVWISSMFCSVPFAWLFHLVGIAWHNHTIDLFSSTCQNHQYTIINYVWALFNRLLRMNQHRLHPQTVFSSKALSIVCVLPACVVHYGIMQGWWTASVSLPLVCHHSWVKWGIVWCTEGCSFHKLQPPSWSWDHPVASV